MDGLGIVWMSDAPSPLPAIPHLAIGLMVLVAGIVRFARTTPADHQGGTLMVFGTLLMIPPVAYVVAALVS